MRTIKIGILLGLFLVPGKSLLAKQGCFLGEGSEAKFMEICLGYGPFLLKPGSNTYCNKDCLCCADACVNWNCCEEPPLCESKRGKNTS